MSVWTQLTILAIPNSIVVVSTEACFVSIIPVELLK
jgi:hypothetical protein